MEEWERGHLVGELPEAKGIPEELKQKIRDQDILFGKTFGTAAGKKVLQYLKDTYIDRPPMGYVRDSNGNICADATTFELYQKEGQRILIKSIEMRIKRANTG